tara:strand:- start:300 stop:797 length:498 start_codon:yes stop_codon:yes gene_type:complete
MRTATGEKQLTGRHVLMMLCGFFGLMFIVNGLFVYFALGSFSGVTDPDAYKRGLAYNEEIDHQAQQLARGWEASLMFDAEAAQKGRLTLEIKNAAGDALAGLDVDATLRRPVIDAGDRKLTFTFDGSAYVADLDFSEHGQWDISILAHGGGYDIPYRLDKRIWVK